MGWVRIDDRFPRHPKVLELSARAIKLWLFAMCHANEHATNGDLTRSVLKATRGTIASARELVEAGLWEETADGWRIHDFLEYQPSRAHREAKRKATRERVSRHREGAGNAPVTPLQTESVTPLPTQPNPTHRSKAAEVDPRTCQVDPLEPDPPRASASAHSVSVVVNNLPPSTLEQALRLDPSRRAQHAVNRPDLVQWWEPRDWPEVQRIAQAWCSAMGWPHGKLGSLARDSGIRAIVGLLADGYTPDELVALSERGKSDEWLRTKAKSLAALTPEVVRRLQADAPAQILNRSQRRALAAARKAAGLPEVSNGTG